VTVTDSMQIACLLPDHADGPALEVMASASALFEGMPSCFTPLCPKTYTTTVAIRRFADYAPQIVLKDLVEGVLEGLDAAIEERVQLRGPEIFERCKKYLEESPQIAEQRAALLAKRKRLVKALQKLREFEVPTVVS
jgi:hypothetical protein